VPLRQNDAQNSKAPPVPAGLCCCNGFCGRRQRSNGEAVVIPFDALGGPGQEGIFLGVLDHFGQAVVDGPTAAADRATVMGFIETVGMETDCLVLVMFAYGALHGVAPFILLSSRSSKIIVLWD